MINDDQNSMKWILVFLRRFPTTASTIQLFGAGGYGVLIGWYVYFINRHRKGDVQLSDLVTLIGVLGGGAIDVWVGGVLAA